ncbi:hypothetical protein G7054_g1768 [Neopestalotiopsis clavispora]|nr:hypothetical protein G7054_g1768 [Neopestalotiopsis clavispora]
MSPFPLQPLHSMSLLVRGLILDSSSTLSAVTIHTLDALNLMPKPQEVANIATKQSRLTMRQVKASLTPTNLTSLLAELKVGARFQSIGVYHANIRLPQTMHICREWREESLRRPIGNGVNVVYLQNMKTIVANESFLGATLLPPSGFFAICLGVGLVSGPPFPCTDGEGPAALNLMSQPQGIVAVAAKQSHLTFRQVKASLRPTTFASLPTELKVGVVAAHIDDWCAKFLEVGARLQSVGKHHKNVRLPITMQVSREWSKVARGKPKDTNWERRKRRSGF